tara:strand:+ start:32 stop:1051 length:1020 start_codon:yes stop_codon:yes gene_type:complete
MDILLKKNKPLLIYGNPGCGKTHLALELLKDTILLRIDSLNLKDIKDIKKYILDRIQKRNITLMFQEIKETRGLLIDDLHTYHKYDKNSFKGILDFIKDKNYYNNKIIITCDTSFLKNKYLKRINLKRFYLKLDYNEYYKTCLSIAKDKKYKYSFDELDGKIYESNYNFHKFKSDCSECVHNNSIRDNFDGIEESTSKMCKKKYDLNEIFRLCSGDEKIILLNMMENINDKNIYKIYNFINIFNDKDIFLKEYELLNIPICFINKYMNHNHEIIYNRYIGRNMITHKNKKIYNEYLYYLIDTYVKHDKYKDIIELYDKSILKYHIEIYENINNIKVLFQ